MHIWSVYRRPAASCPQDPASSEADTGRSATGGGAAADGGSAANNNGDAAAADMAADAGIGGVSAAVD